jgi:hypothetical protein
MNMLLRLNQALDRFEPTVRLLYRIGVVLAVYFGLAYIGDSLVITDGTQTETSCEAPSRYSS